MLPRTRDRLFVAAWLAWTGFVLSHYYVQVVHLLAAPRLPARAGMIRAAIPVLLVAGIGLLAAIPRSWRGRIGPRAVAPGRSPAILLAMAGGLTVPWFMVRPQLAAALSGLGAPGFPWIGEAAARAGAALVGAGLVAASALSAGSIVLRSIGWRPATRVEHVVFAGVTGVGVVAYTSLLLASAGLYRPMAVALLIAALLLAGVPLARNVRVGLRRSGAAGTSPLTAAWLALAGVALAYGLIAALAPEKEYDALWYHLQFPRLWLGAGRPVDRVEEYVSLYPLTWELVFGAGMVLGGPVGAKLLHFACLPLLAALVGQAARRFVPGVSPVVAAVLVVTTPTLLWESSTAYVDLALALHAAAACYALARYTEEGERAWGLVAALQFGLAASTKHLGVFVTLIALSLFLLAAARGTRSPRRALKPAILIALVAAAVPSPWYLRAWLASGNPVFPEMFSVFGASPPDRWDAIAEQSLAQFKAQFGLGRSAGALLALPWNVTIHGARFFGSLGPLFLVLLPVLFLVRRRTPALVWLAGGVAAYMAAWASPISSFQLRFLMPIVPPLALLAAASLEAVGRWAAGAVRHGRTAAITMVIGLAALNLPPFTSVHEADRAGWDRWLTHVLRAPPLSVVAGKESEASYLRREVPAFGAWQFINARLPADVRVLTFSGGDQLYADRPRIPADATMARAAVWDATAQHVDDSVAALRRLRITHVLFDRRELAGVKAGALAIASPRLQQACISEYDNRRYWLCRLDYTRLDSIRRGAGE
jgi:hypothetical protein